MKEKYKEQLKKQVNKTGMAESDKAQICGVLDANSGNWQAHFPYLWHVPTAAVSFLGVIQPKKHSDAMAYKKEGRPFRMLQHILQMDDGPCVRSMVDYIAQGKPGSAKAFADYLSIAHPVKQQAMWKDPAFRETVKGHFENLQQLDEAPCFESCHTVQELTGAMGVAETVATFQKHGADADWAHALATGKPGEYRSLGNPEVDAQLDGLLAQTDQMMIQACKMAEALDSKNPQDAMDDLSRWAQTAEAAEEAEPAGESTPTNQ